MVRSLGWEVGTEEKEKPSLPPREAHLYGSATGWIYLCRASLRDKDVLGGHLEAGVGSSVPKGTEITILVGTGDQW